MNVDLNGKSKFPEINAHRERLIAQMKKLEKEGKQNGRKYKRAAMALQKLQLMNYIEPSGSCNYSPEEFSKTASEKPTIADAYLAGYMVGGCMDKEAKTLTSAGRSHIKQKNFGIPSNAEGKKEKKKSGNYPIHDKAHARSALAYGSRFLSPEEYASLKKRVHAKYPDMK